MPITNARGLERPRSSIPAAASERTSDGTSLKAPAPKKSTLGAEKSTSAPANDVLNPKPAERAAKYETGKSSAPATRFTARSASNSPGTTSDTSRASPM